MATSGANGPGSATASASNPRKFSEKIALQKQRQAEETAAFEEVMMDIGSTRVRGRRAAADRGAIGVAGAGASGASGAAVWEARMNLVLSDRKAQEGEGWGAVRDRVSVAAVGGEALVP